MMDETYVAFFRATNDPDMQRTCMDMRNDFTDSDHNLLEIEHQIIDYINQIDQQSLLLKQIRKVKYLKDQLTWREDSNVVQLAEENNSLWIEKRPYNRVFLSLNMLSTDEDAIRLIRKIAGNSASNRLSRTEAEPLDKEYLEDSVENVESVNITELWNSFKAQGTDLFSFVRSYHYKRPLSLSEHVVLYCQIATQHSDELRITDNYERFDHIEYALIYA
jgi:hypothetical protein